MDNKHQHIIHIAGVPLTLVPHCVDGAIAYVFVELDATGGAHKNYTPDDLRFLAAQLKIAADEAESIERKFRRRA